MAVIVDLRQQIKDSIIKNRDKIRQLGDMEPKFQTEAAYQFATLGSREFPEFIDLVDRYFRGQEEMLLKGSGVSQERLHEMWEEAKNNVKRLNECPDHDFEPIDPEPKLGTRYRCKNCDGEISGSSYHWYLKGRKHEQVRSP